jgi:tRNA threonylcarbamoyl adenosine modification protein YeaZ
VLLLALDTATPAVTVALHDGDKVIAESRQVDARRHGELLLPAVHRVLGEADRTLDDVTGIVVGVGPGPYTGLRVGIVTAATFAAALSVPVHGLCSLDGIAYAAGQAGLEGEFVVATDARRKEVYWARYADARTRVTEPLAGLTVVGAGGLLYRDAFTDVRDDMPEHQSAGALASLAAERLRTGGEFLPDRPLYLRRPDAQVPANYKVVTPK